MIVELETAIPRPLLMPVTKPYIHFLKLSPPEDIDLDNLWMSLGYSDDKIASQKDLLFHSLHQSETEIMKEIEVTFFSIQT